MLIVVGTNHKYSPIAIRESLAFSRRKIPEFLLGLTGSLGINGGVILSTCNRVELYASVADIALGLRTLKLLLVHNDAGALTRIEPYLYTYIGKEAALHLFKVASGLDSQIIGENQILEQVKFAYAQARRQSATDELLGEVFDGAIKVSQEVKQMTNISEGDISLSTVVMEFIEARYGFLRGKKMLIIGVGKISQMLMDCLKDKEVEAVFIANRTYEKALALAEKINARVVRFDCLREKLIEADIVISATASPHLILKKEDLLEVKKPLLVVDLAVPRDIDPGVKEIKGITLFNLDDFSYAIEKKIEQRKEGIPLATGIIISEVEKLWERESLKSAPEPALLL